MTDKIFANICKNAVPEGMVLLENNSALPLVENENIALFGRGQFEYLKSGSGSGGKVRCPYVTNIYDEIKNRVNLDRNVTEFYKNFILENPFDIGDGWKPCFCQKDAVPTAEMLKKSCETNDKAIYIICRNVGESFDYQKVKGEWYLSDEEETTISLLSRYFKKVIVLLNSGNVMDMSWVKKYNIGTVAYIWQGGQEGGVGTVSALMGDIPPSGRLTSTIVTSPDDYPCDDCFGGLHKNIHKEDIFVGYRYFETFAQDKVLYPFGYGLNYTTFEQCVVSTEKTGDEITIKVLVKNTGDFAGKDVVQVYLSAPQGKLGKANRVLIAFKKTDLLQKGESQTIELKSNICDFASYDDCGKSGNKFAWVLEEGSYTVFSGQNVRDAVSMLEFTEPKTRVVKQCVQALAPIEKFDRMVNNNGKIGFETTPVMQYDLSERINRNLPKPIAFTGDMGINLQDVSSGKNTVEQFVAQFDQEALCLLVKSEGMSSSKATYPGTASCFGGITKAWNEKGVSVVTTCDGPSGIRMESGAQATCIPVGQLLASTWAPELFEDMYKYLTDEIKFYDIDVLLGPGMNIHRSGLCGRNFEYFSEDPYLTGVYAAKFAEYFTQNGVFCTLKHFAANSQELNRYDENEVLSERALREIYLKPFEIAVKGGFAKTIMTSYNRINGVHAADNYDLTTTVLRDDWGYDGIVMTDWGTEMDDERKAKPSNRNFAAMVKAQNDIYSIVTDVINCNDDLEESLESGYLTLGELQRCAVNIIKFVMQTYAFKSKRKQNINDLSSADQLLFAQSLLDIPLEIRKELNSLYHNKPKRAMNLNLDSDGVYCVEIAYKLEGNALEQKHMYVYIDKNEPILLLGIVDGKTQKQRFKAFLKKDSIIYFEEEVSKMAIYKL